MAERPKSVTKALKHPDVPGAGAKARRHLKGKNKVHAVMSEFKRGTLRSGSGGHVKSREQAVAIALSEARKAGVRIPKRNPNPSVPWAPSALKILKGTETPIGSKG